MAGEQFLPDHRVLFKVVAVLGSLCPCLAGQASKVGEESLDLAGSGTVGLGAGGGRNRREVVQRAKKLLPKALQFLGLLLHI
jgi:hypothetical protein